MSLKTSCLMGKQTICIYAKTKAQISAFVFATQIVQSLYFLNTNCMLSSCLLLLCSSVCVGPGRKPQRWFSHKMAEIRKPVFQVATKSCGVGWNEYLLVTIPKTLRQHGRIQRGGQGVRTPPPPLELPDY